MTANPIVEYSLTNDQRSLERIIDGGSTPAAEFDRLQKRLAEALESRATPPIASTKEH
jgi:hypothetical protein